MTAGKRLAAAVHVQHPTSGERLVLLPGDPVPPEIAELITHPDAFLPDPDEDDNAENSGPPAKPTRSRKTRTDNE
ncbi:hypothetical protein ACFV4P_02680 [Kitasatospora sp. NPDC059795]|uniref:hypothetical protein n=1 Tax=Kitasatospora sp. NPDC059795 TaxID=3346949 RepID=UPI00364D6B2F